MQQEHAATCLDTEFVAGAFLPRSNWTSISHMIVIQKMSAVPLYIAWVYSWATDDGASQSVPSLEDSVRMMMVLGR